MKASKRALPQHWHAHTVFGPAYTYDHASRGLTQLTHILHVYYLSGITNTQFSPIYDVCVSS